MINLFKFACSFGDNGLPTEVTIASSSDGVCYRSDGADRHSTKKDLRLCIHNELSQ